MSVRDVAETIIQLEKHSEDTMTANFLLKNLVIWNWLWIFPEM